MDYSKFCVENAANFLQSVTIIDDQFLWAKGSTVNVEVSLTPPSQDEFEGDGAHLEATPSLRLDGAIDLRSIVRGFSEMGIVCCPYEWTEKDNEPPKSAYKSDVIIFDWKLAGDGGEDGLLVSNFIKSILDRDNSGTPRLRFISIYSSEDSTTIFDTLYKLFEGESGYTTELRGSTLDVTAQEAVHAVRLQYISKSDVQGAELAKVMVESFSSFVDGFLPNIVLSAVTEIRERSFEYLARFHKGLDMAILSHYTALRSQKNAFPTSSGQFRDYVSNLIGGSVQDSLTYSTRVKDSASLEKINEYIESKDSVVLGIDESKNIVDKAKILELLKIEECADFITASADQIGISGDDRKNFKSGKTPLFFDPQESDSKLELTQLDLQKNHYTESNSPPILRLGSIVKLVEDFYVCTQPLCEGVRLKEEKDHSFSFIKLKEASGEGNFFFVVNDGGHYRKFTNETRQEYVLPFLFRSNIETKDVRAKYIDGKFVFVTTIQQPFHWLGELKDVYSQELLHRLAHAASRVGSDKYEWMRLQQP